MNAKEYRRRWLEAKADLERTQKYVADLEQAWIEGDVALRQMKARAEAAEAKLSAAREFVAEANEEFTKAAAEDAAMVEQFNG